MGQNSGILNLLQSIQSGQQTQNVTIQSLVDKIDSLESELYNEAGEDDHVDYDDDCLLTLFSKPMLQRLQSESVQINTK